MILTRYQSKISKRSLNDHNMISKTSESTLTAENGTNNTKSKSILNEKNKSVGGVTSTIKSILNASNKLNTSKMLMKKLKQFKESHPHSIFVAKLFRIFHLFIFVIISLFIVYQVYLNTMLNMMDKDDFNQIPFYVQTRISYGYEIFSNKLLLWMPAVGPIAFGILFSVFSYMIVYLNGKIPGVHPPSPFSPTSKKAYRKQKTFSIDLSYITALSSGVIVAGLMLHCF